MRFLLLLAFPLSGCLVDVGGPVVNEPLPGLDDDVVPGGQDELGDARADLDPDVPPAPLEDDGALLVEVSLPSTLGCGESALAAVTVQNVGALTWTRDTHKLGAVDDGDSLFGADPRVYLADGETVAPGARHTFTFTLTAAVDATGVLTTDWQMVHEGVLWFGPVAAASVDVTCDVVEPPPETPPGQPLPDRRAVVQQVADERPDLLAQSCVDSGGNNDFLDLVVDRLRQEDTRWGYNWKRGNVGDLSQDVVDYFTGDGDPEGSTDVYIVDMIGGHCGDNPSPAWTDVTQATLDGGTIGRWTGNGLF